MSEQYNHLTGGPAAPAAPATSPGWAPEPEKPRKKHPFRRVVLWTAGSGLALLVGVGTIAGIASGGTKHSAPAPASSSSNIPDSGTTEAPPKTDPIPDEPVSSLRLPLGTPEIITQGSTDAAIVKISDAQVFTTPADEYGSSPQHGYFVVVKVSAKVLPEFTEGFDIYSGDFYAKSGGEHFDEGDGNSYSAMTMDQEDLGYTTLAAGEHKSGLLVFDVPNPHGTIVYAPNYDGQPLASWKF
jgi:hypothetical protein